MAEISKPDHTATPSADPLAAATAPPAAGTAAGNEAGTGKATAAGSIDPFDLRTPYGSLKFEIERSIRYHQRRRSHYERLDRTADVITILSGAGVFGSALGSGANILGIERDLAIGFLGVLAMLSSAAAMIWRPGVRAKEHFHCTEAFVDLDRDLERALEEGQLDVKLPGLRLRRREIELKELPTFWIVEADAFNEAARAFGKRKQVPLTWWQRRTMNFRHGEGVVLPEAALPEVKRPGIR